MKIQWAPKFWPPGPGIRLLCFCIIYLAIVILPQGQWWRFIVLMVLALALVPPGIVPLRNAMKMLLRSMPILLFLALMVWLFGTTGNRSSDLVVINVMVRTVAVVAAAAVIWGGAGTLDFIRALHQLRIPGLAFSMITLAIHFMGRIAKNARATMDAVRARSAQRIPISRRIALFSPLIRHFLTQVVDSHSQIHMAMVSRGYTGAALTLERPPVRPGEWVFLAGFSMTVLGVMILW